MNAAIPLADSASQRWARKQEAQMTVIRPPMLTLDDARGNTAALVALKRAAQDGIQIALS